MRYFIAVCWIATSSFLLGQIPEPPALPEGLFCSPQGTITSDGHVFDGAPAHQCHCEHMTYSKDCEGYVQENSKCKQHCHKDHCHCPVKCEPVDLQPDGSK